jgi:hypothetical protein
VSLDHLSIGIAGGFTQAGHGSAAKLRRLSRGDVVALYSPRTALDGGEPLQCFTAIGRVIDDAPYQAEMAPDFHPWRRRVEFLPGKPAPARELIDRLDFIPDKSRWGYPFRRGLFEISDSDCATIATAMGTTL